MQNNPPAYHRLCFAWEGIIKTDSETKLKKWGEKKIIYYWVLQVQTGKLKLSTIAQTGFWTFYRYTETTGTFL